MTVVQGCLKMHSWGGLPISRPSLKITEGGFDEETK